MSAITSDWALPRRNAPALAARSTGAGREEVFSSALDNYMVGYVAEQKRRRVASRLPDGRTRDGQLSYLRRLMGWRRNK